MQITSTLPSGSVDGRVRSSPRVPVVGSRVDGALWWLLVAVAGPVWLAATLAFFPFTADDSYIVARYAENLVDHGELAYNLGERVMAFTSPLQVAVEAVLYRVTGATVTGYKLLGVALFLLSFGVLLRAVNRGATGRSMALIVVALSPSVLLWTTGGLGTPLLLALATALAAAATGAADRPVSGERADDDAEIGTGRLWWIFIFAGLCFVARYDSVLFTVPIVLAATMRAPRLRSIGIAALAGATVPLAWLGFAAHYYGDILPTSFHVKMPDAGSIELARNVGYVAAQLAATGVLPLFGFLLVRDARRGSLALVAARARRHWGLAAGVLAMVVYGLWVATTHMMFGFRYFVPYLPATVLLLTRLFDEAPATGASADGVGRDRAGRGILVLALILSLFQGYQIARTYSHSMNGIVGIGEYLETGSRNYHRDVTTARRVVAEEIRRHWTARGLPRAPRIFTTAGGLPAYAYREAYYLERLVSYRRECLLERADLARFADYVHFATPRHGRVDARLPGETDRYELVSSELVPYDGVLENFVVYYNPEPAANPLPARVADACEP